MYSPRYDYYRLVLLLVLCLKLLLLIFFIFTLPPLFMDQLFLFLQYIFYYCYVIILLSMSLLQVFYCLYYFFKFFVDYCFSLSFFAMINITELYLMINDSKNQIITDLYENFDNFICHQTIFNQTLIFGCFCYKYFINITIYVRIL